MVVNGGVLEVAAGYAKYSSLLGVGNAVRNRSLRPVPTLGRLLPTGYGRTVWHRPKAPGEVVAYGGSPGCPGSEPDGNVPSRSVAPPTRLEERTKECNMYASHWVD